MNITKQQLIYGAVLLLTGLLLGWLMFGGSNDHANHNLLSDAEMNQHLLDEHTDEDGTMIYTCSMHPSVLQNEPGNCPICGMELIPARSQSVEAHEDEYSMVMTASAARLADIQTVPIERRVPEKVLDLPGRIQVDERRLTNVTAHVSGRIRDLNIDYTGAPIRRGEVMATIYSPELIAAQRELLEAARQKERNPQLYESARQKFRLWEFTEEQINAMEERGSAQIELDILSPANGFVMSRNVAAEEHVMEGTVIFEVANLDRIWVVLEAYEEDLNWISLGDTFHFQTRTNPGQHLEATVSFIDPVVDSRSRTVRIRANLDNSSGLLKPDMLVRAQLNSRMQDEKLLVPASSVLWTGKRSLIYVKDTSADLPRFDVREVELGMRTGDYYVIEDGVQEGEEVVFHGAFRIDSEMQLADRFSMMNREPGRGAVPVHDHSSGTDRDGMDLQDYEEAEREEGDGLQSHTDAVDGVTEDFQQDFPVLLEAYLEGKDALFNADVDAAAEAFQQAVTGLEAIGMHRMQGDAHIRWMEHYEAVEGHLNQILEADGLDGQRKAFASLSQTLIEAVKMYQIPGVVYHQYCPMEDKSWLSSEEQIQNPYAPETMPNCGEVIVRIES
ncbi:MAG: efflux RND transporter periplasmic adaptor subunit [Balneolaceae bacterium]